MIDFNISYSRDNAISFLSRFLPEDFKTIVEENITVNFKPQFIEQVNKLGESSSLQDLHIFEILHGSENDPRIGLSRDAFRLLANFGIRKALIFFISRKTPNYRFSFVTLDLKWESGKKVEREYSNPRRYSFFLGPDARVHTPHDFLIKKGQVKDIADLLSRFDVEIVTKEFFTQYKRLFEDVSDYLKEDHGFKIFAERNDIDIDTFAKKLLGQIVFCYFLQRKGWLGAKREESINEGNKDFMRSLFEHCAEGKNFYNDCLEYLFYGSLNSRAEGSGDFYRKHFHCQIPFLNGGLFEPPEDYDWEKSFIRIPDKIFSNKQKTGILDIFNLYNFTVYEDDPIDREVSVDPEMLGKVFENLLPENLRKGQGAYYTPREIVHYMCQESLINYLATETNVGIDKIRHLVVNKLFEGMGNKESIDRALQNIKVCDPACGSGAFLVGMLHEIVSVRHTLNPAEAEYNFKKEAIQNSIYGVDIDPGAVDIAKLRLWLSLVVDYELKEIEPLPNLDYKIMCGNSLLEEFEGVRFYDGDMDGVSLFKDERKQKIQELRESTKEYFLISDEKEKRKKRDEVNRLKDWFIKTTLEKRRKEITRERRNIEAKADMFEEKNRQEYFVAQGKIFISEAKINEVLRELHNPQKARPFFIWKLEFMDVFEDRGGFDVVLGNPPYISAVEHSKTEDKIRTVYRIKYPLVKGAFDIYVIFLLRGIYLSAKKGNYSWIIPNKFLVSSYSENILEYLKQNGLNAAIDVSKYDVFDNTGVYPIILLGNKTADSFDEYEITSLLDLESNRLEKRTKLKEFKTFKDYQIKIGSGTTGFQAQQIVSYISDKATEDSIPFVVSGSVDKYSINFCNVRYMGHKYSKAFIKKGNGIAESKWNFWQKEKIVIAGMTKEIEASYYTKPLGLGVGLYAIYDYGGFNPKFLLALLNSRYLSYYLNIKFKDKHLAGGYLAINKSTIEKLPLIDLSLDKQKEFIDYVDKIIAITESDDYENNLTKQAKVREYELRIDHMVYKLYELTPEEIEIVECTNSNGNK